MAIFNNMYLTNAGQVLFTKAQAGQQVNFTKMQVGAGQIGTQNPATLNALINPKFDVAIQSITANTELKTATISGTVNNTGITEAVYICEIGLWANDPQLGEILYGYASAGIYGDYYAPESAGPYTWNYDINAAIGNAANVTAQLSSLNYDYGIINTNTTFTVISGGNQKEINKSIDAFLSDLTFQTAGGTATAITLTLQTLVNGYAKTFIASANNGGAATTINNKPVYKPGTTTAPKFIAGKAYTVWYNSSGNNGNGCFFIKASATGTALARQVLKDVPFSNEEDTDLLGTLDLSLLVSGNIKAGIIINGVTGKSSVVDTADATALAGNILSGETVYVNGSKVTGTIPSITGDGNAHYPATQLSAGAYSGDGQNYAYMGVPTGNYLNGVSWIKSLQPYLLSQYIVSGASILGVAGSATIESLGGKLYAVGSVAVTPTKVENIFPIGFEPNIVITKSDSGVTCIAFRGCSFAPDCYIRQFASGATVVTSPNVYNLTDANVRNLNYTYAVPIGSSQLASCTYYGAVTWWAIKL